MNKSFMGLTYSRADDVYNLNVKVRLFIETFLNKTISFSVNEFFAPERFYLRL